MTDPVVPVQAATTPAAAPVMASVTDPAPTQAATQAATSATATATPPASPGNAEAKPAEAAPLKLSLPEGSPLSEAHMAKISEMAQKQGWSQEVAQEVLARQSDAVKEHISGLEAQHKASIEAWNKELTADKEIGGQALSANLNAGRRALDQFGSPELVEALRASGYSTYPPLVKMLVKVGLATTEDRIAPGSSGDGRSAAQRLYPSMPNP